MRTIVTPIFGQLLITPFIVVELGIVAWYLLYWDLFRNIRFEDCFRG
jgi:hypothetical protein